MDTILENLKQQKAVENKSYTDLLAEAGFPKLIPSYPVITVEAIRDYLYKQFKKINKRARESKMNWWEDKEKNRIYIWYKGGRYDDLEWLETPVNKFDCQPPLHVLENIQKAKNNFDELFVVTVNEVRDPLIVGRNKGSNRRYLIDWWDNDINVDEINFADDSPQSN